MRIPERGKNISLTKLANPIIHPPKIDKIINILLLVD